MKRVITTILSVMLIAATLFTFVGCDDVKDSEYIMDKGTLIVGVTDYEPLDYLENGEWTGFDAELARLVGEKLGLKVVFQEINWSMKETELAGKTIDCIWNGLTWDKDRAQNMSLSDYYMINKQVLVVKSENASKYNTVDSMKSASFAAEGGSAGETFIKEKFANSQFIDKEAQIDVLTELLAGTVEIGVIDYVMANYLINKPGSSFSGLTIVDGVIEAESEYYSIAFRNGSDMTAKVNEIVKGFREDGTIETLAKKYGLTDAVIK